MDKERIERGLSLDAPAEVERIETFLRERLETLQRRGAVLALSGGLDSAVTAALTVRALGENRVTLVNLPERDSSPVHRQHARRFAESLGARFVAHSITPILRAAGTYRLLPLRFLPGRKLRARLVEYARSRFIGETEKNLLIDRLKPPESVYVARGNAYVIAKHRTRMVVLYQYAEVRHLMVVGAANRTEWLTGTFSKWGVDHCADVMPVLHLYRSQLEKLAVYLEIPDYLVEKPADPDVIPGVNDKGALLGDFEEVDQVLFALEAGVDEAELKAAFSAEMVERLAELRSLSAHMRESPYALD